MASGEDIYTYGAENLRALRTAAGMSRRELVEELSLEGPVLHQTTLRRLEEGEQTMKASEAVAIARFFETSVDDFLCKPIDTVGADLIPLTRSVSKYCSEIPGKVDYAVTVYDVLRDRLQQDDVPPAVRSTAVRDAQEMLEKHAALVEELRDVAARFWRSRWSTEVGDDGEG